MIWECVFFDFDGVILDSVNVKTQAFAEMFRPFGSIIEAEVVAYHLANGGISRYEKFRYYYENILKKKINDRELHRLGKVFSGLVLKRVLTSPFITGALESLHQIKKFNIPAFVASGTPQEEINYIVEKRGLSHFFKEVHGSPRKKNEIISKILEENGFQCSRCLFIGDALSDYNAAMETGIRFLGIVKKDDRSPFPNGTVFFDHVTLNICSE